MHLAAEAPWPEADRSLLARETFVLVVQVNGRIRDRVILLGTQASRPHDVDSLDELLFMAPRSLIAREPLSEAPELAWHAYAVEYGLRARSLGLRVCALDLPVTHNSLTTNLDRLDVAYAAVAAQYPGSLPVRATCGTIGGHRAAARGAGPLAAHRWRYRWMRESLAAYAGRWAAGGGACVLGDIRVDIDEQRVVAAVPASELRLTLLVTTGGGAVWAAGWNSVARIDPSRVVP